MTYYITEILISVAERSKVRVWVQFLAGISGSNTAEGVGVSVVSVVCSQVEVSATG
jgi:hypothetical protein